MRQFQVYRVGQEADRYRVDNESDARIVTLSMHESPVQKFHGIETNQIPR